MDCAKLEEELAEYPSKELQYIHDTQQDLYSADELDYMRDIVERRKREELERMKAFLPKEIECEKCGAPNEFERSTCKYCENELDKSAYYEKAEFLAQGGDPDDLEEEGSEELKSYAFQYIASFLIPIVGYIMGAILLTKDEEDQRSAEKACLIIAIISMVVSIIVFTIFTHA